MKKLILMIVLSSLGCGVLAQKVSFRQDLEWLEIIREAKAKQKYIFVDCYATWCVPCKKMDADVFPKADLAEFIDSNFIALKIQFDSTGLDDHNTRRWFKVSKEFSAKYQISGYPSYLIFNSDGVLVTKLGSEFNSSLFLQSLRWAIKPENQYYQIKNKYLEGNSNINYLRMLLPEAVRLSDIDFARQIHNDFIQKIKQPYSKKEFFAIYTSLSSLESLGLPIVIDSIEKHSTLIEDGSFAKEIVKKIILLGIVGRFGEVTNEGYDWEGVKNYLNTIASTLSSQILMELRMSHSLNLGNWESYSKLKLDYYDKYYVSFNHNELFFMNNDLYEIFKRINDKQTLKRAAEWSRITIEDDNGSPESIDTYANLLYKLGQKNEAIIWQKKALDILMKQNSPDAEAYIKTLDKMILGKCTWEN